MFFQTRVCFGYHLVTTVYLLHESIVSLELQYNHSYLSDNVRYVIEYFSAELFVNGEIVQRSPERQRRVEPVPQRAQDRPRYNDRTRYVRRRENQR